ncbi:MAG TPA: hypothetical protein VFD32_01650, partial [Dehalococcoidia bacterium]|nr:hypothetical protein [Dehalococcoidia bacterium]
FESTAARVVFSLVYIALALGMLWYQRRNAGALWRWWRWERQPGATRRDLEGAAASPDTAGQ